MKRLILLLIILGGCDTMGQDNYFQVRRFELADRVPQIEIYLPSDDTVRVYWDYSNEYHGKHTIVTSALMSKGNHYLEPPFPLKPNQDVRVLIQTNGGDFIGTLLAPPIDKETGAPD